MTDIEWTHREGTKGETWNPVRGCDKISPGCKNCYASTFAERWRGIKGHPYKQGFDLRLVPEALDKPLRWREPRTIFVNSMSDLFHKDVPDAFIVEVFARMALTRRHTHQVLTKRAERLASLVADEHFGVDVLERALKLSGSPGSDALQVDLWPLPNVWLGVSVEDQKRADERIPHLLSTPAAVRFLSCEPLLESVNLGRWLEWTPLGPDENDEAKLRPPLSWVIVGGESGPGSRSFDIAWARSIVAQCSAAGVACFVKQLGAKPVRSEPFRDGTQQVPIRLGRNKGGDPAEWPADLRVRQWPEVRA